jgi:hypothetical protein
MHNSSEHFRTAQQLIISRDLVLQSNISHTTLHSISTTPPPKAKAT